MSKFKLTFDPTDLDLFSSYVKTTNSSAGWRIKFKGEFLIIKGKTIWPKISQAKSAFTRRYSYGLGNEFFTKYKNSVPRNVFGRDILKAYVEELQSKGILEFFEVK
jgi:hypothetical protein